MLFDRVCGSLCYFCWCACSSLCVVGSVPCVDCYVLFVVVLLPLVRLLVGVCCWVSFGVCCSLLFIIVCYAWFVVCCLLFCCLRMPLL